MMKKLAMLFLAAMLLFGACAQADNRYLIADSNTRLLTEDELWKWDYEALGYILNEIFARHGYHFEAGGKYEAYFENQDWYEESTIDRTNQEVYSRLNEIEWKNERKVKDVMGAMRNMNTTNPKGRSIHDRSGEAQIRGAFAEFEEIFLSPNRKLAVYSGPGKHYYRGANGKAMASTNGRIYAAGYDGDWLMVMYWTNGGSVRVGYASHQDAGQWVDLPDLNFSYSDAVITSRCDLTDDPAQSYTQLTRLTSGTAVRYLGRYENQRDWAYIETTVDGRMARGFVPADCVSVY